jgi:methanogenic corrinoid protein MtbC1
MPDLLTREHTFAESFLHALLDADRRVAADVTHAAIAGLPDAITVLDGVITPAMHEIGRLWEIGDITIADEHLATAIANQALPLLFANLAPSRTNPTPAPRVLLACAYPENHSLGLRMIADVLDANGFDVRYAGANVPVEDLPRALARHRPDLVALGATLELSRPGLEQAVESVRAVAPELPILIGGAAAEGLATDELTAIGATAREGLQLARRFTAILE